MQHDGKLETCPFRGPIFIKKKSEIEKLFQNNNNNGLMPKYFNKNIDTSTLGSSKLTFVWHKDKVNSFHFFDPYDHINTMYNNNEDTHLLNAHEEHITKED